MTHFEDLQQILESKWTWCIQRQEYVLVASNNDILAFVALCEDPIPAMIRCRGNLIKNYHKEIKNG